MSRNVAIVNEHQMRLKLDACKQCITKLLNAHKAAAFQAADEVQQHTYSDKYLLAEQLTTTAAACLVNSLEAVVGFDEMVRVLPLLRSWSVEQEVSLRFEFEERCEFVREQERDEEDPTRVETEVTGSRMFKATTKVIRKVKEYVYRFDCSYRVVAYRGVYEPLLQVAEDGSLRPGDGSSGQGGEEKVVVLRHKVARQELITRTKTPPYVQRRTDGRDVNVSWLLRLLDKKTCSSMRFSIDRAQAQCYTPYQNRDVQGMVGRMQELSGWAQWTGQYLMSQLFEVQLQYTQKKERVDTSVFEGGNVFNPIVPILEDREVALESLLAITDGGGAGGVSDSVVVADIGGSAIGADGASSALSSCTALSGQTVNMLAAEQRRTLTGKCAEMKQLLASANGHAIITAADAQLCVVLSHMQHLVAAYCGSVLFIEEMIRKQLVAAIGKVVQPSDFAQYMIFHNRKVLREQYRPQPFSFAIRRSPQHSPEGLIRIELGGGEVSDSKLPEAIHTISCLTETSSSGSDVRRMQFAINASTKVQFGGDRYVHGWLAHHFHGQDLPKLQLVSQARQFSSYIVLLGRIISGREFEPKYGFIVQNKDEVQIPLDLERIPTPKEFRDAISSLSPEQQRFAKAFRSMQLESTLFAVCTIQIKPQLEKVLNLAPDSLTKEIKLTQELMKLFIEYQIPSDLLSFDEIAASASSGLSGLGCGAGGDEFELVGASSSGAVRQVSSNFTSADRLRVVKAQVAAMQAMIKEAKEEEVREKNQEREFLFGKPTISDKDYDDALLEIQFERCLERNVELNCLVDQAETLQSSANVFKKSAKRSSGIMKSLAAPFKGGTTLFGASAPAARECAAPPGARLELEAKLSNIGFAPSDSKIKDLSKAEPKELTRAEEPAASVENSNKLQTAKNEPEETRRKTIEGTQEVDYTKFPTLLDQNYERFDEDSALRPTIINPGSTWQKKAQAALLAKPTTRTLSEEEQSTEKQSAFDLLDALTRSGALAVEDATLHVVIAATHCFDKSLMNTVVQRNMNPIEKVERSALIMASTLHGVDAAELVVSEQLERVRTYAPTLFMNDEETPASSNLINL